MTYHCQRLLPVFPDHSNPEPAPVFQTDTLKTLPVLPSMSPGVPVVFSLFAYVIMPDHIHTVTDGALNPSETLRFLNDICSATV